MIAARLTVIPPDRPGAPMYVACDCGWWMRRSQIEHALEDYSEHVGGPIHSSTTDPRPMHDEEPF